MQGPVLSVESNAMAHGLFAVFNEFPELVIFGNRWVGGIISRLGIDPARVSVWSLRMRIHQVRILIRLQFPHLLSAFWFC